MAQVSGQTKLMMRAVVGYLGYLDDEDEDPCYPSAAEFQLMHDMIDSWEEPVRDLANPLFKLCVGMCTLNREYGETLRELREKAVVLSNTLDGFKRIKYECPNVVEADAATAKAVYNRFADDVERMRNMKIKDSMAKVRRIRSELLKLIN